MTRETKIGLLVGLAFIIVVGILLSDHINSSTDPVQAQMTTAFASAEQSVNSPDSRTQGTIAVVTPAPVIPQNPVPTQHEPASSSPPGSTVVDISPGGNPSQLKLPSGTPEAQTSNGTQALPPDQIANNTSSDTNANVPGSLQQVAKENGNELVPADSQPDHVRPTPAPAGPVALSGSMRQIKAEENDTVTRLAAKYMGGNTKANREAIIKANPSMTPDGHLVIAGRTYLIPAGSASPVAIVPPPQPAQRARPVTPAPVPAGVTLYTVKDNDSLWKIASEQLGSGSRWTEIRDLNADVLKGGAQIHVNMRLKLPAKSVASAN